MPVAARPLMVWGAAALLAAGCTQSITGTAVRAVPGLDDDSLSPVDVETIVLNQSEMRAITGAGDDQRCGDHEARVYVSRVNSYKRVFAALAARGED